jgi:heme exporter protein D
MDFDAGKYAAYVWPAFAVTAAVFAGMIAASLSHARRWRKRAERARGERGSQSDAQP